METISITTLQRLPGLGHLEPYLSPLHVVEDLSDFDFLLSNLMLFIDLCKLLRRKLLVGEEAHEVGCPLLQRHAELTVQGVPVGDVLDLILCELSLPQRFICPFEIICCFIDFGDDSVILPGLLISLADHPAVVAAPADQSADVSIGHADVLWIMMVLFLVSHFGDQVVDLAFG